MRITRRNWLRGLLALIGWAASSTLAPGSLGHAYPAPREGRWRQEGSAFGSGLGEGMAVDAEGKLSLSSGASQGVYLSGVQTADFPFNAVGARWSAMLPEGADFGLEMRAGAGEAWSDWHPVGALVHTPSEISARGEESGELTFLQGEKLQYRLLLSSREGARPSVQWVELIYIDSSAGPDVVAAQRAGAGAVGSLALSRPPIIPRGGWGCPEPDSSVNWPPPEVPPATTKIIIHHTDTTSYQDPAQVIRAVWSYHAITQRWGDIGYNYLVDWLGNIYQGRFSSTDAWDTPGGHALCFNWGSVGLAVLGDYDQVDISPAAQDGLVNLIAWKCSQRDIDPLGRSYFIQKDMDNITSHRDGNGYCGVSTLCPGNFLYNRLPAIRSAVVARMKDLPIRYFGVVWGSYSLSGQMPIGGTVPVRVEVRNVGRLVWQRDGPGAVRLGYHWYRPDGVQYPQAPAEDRRSTLPVASVGYQQTVTIEGLVTAPRVAGIYTLQLDLVQEGVTWFAKEPANRTLDLRIEVKAPQLQVAPVGLVFVAQVGQNPSPQTVAVANASLGSFSWQGSVASTPSPWLQISPLQADRPGQLQVSAKVKDLNLPVGTYQGEVSLIASSVGPVGGSPRTIPVRLVVVDHLYRQHFPQGFKAGGGS